MNAGHCLSHAAWLLGHLSHLQVVHWYSALVTLHSLVGWFFEQFEHASSALQVTTICFSLIIWHLKHFLGSSSSFLALCHVLSMRIPLFITLFAAFAKLSENMVCAFIWLGFQVSGFLNHFAPMIVPAGISFLLSITVKDFSKQFQSPVERNCTTTWYGLALSETTPRKHCSKAFEISFCLSQFAPFSSIISNRTPPFFHQETLTLLWLSLGVFDCLC